MMIVNVTTAFSCCSFYCMHATAFFNRGYQGAKTQHNTTHNTHSVFQTLRLYFLEDRR